MEFDLSVIDWVALSAVATLFVAVAAILAIRFSNRSTTRLINEARDKEQRDKNERMLKEIIDWASEVLRHGTGGGHGQFTKDLIRVKRGITVGESNLRDLQRLEWANRLDKMTSILVTQKRGLYINKITDRYFTKLSPIIETIRQALLHHATLLGGLATTTKVGKEMETKITERLADLEEDELLKEVFTAASEEKEYDEEEQEKRKIELGKQLDDNWTSVKSFAEDLIDKSVSLI